MIHFDVTKTGDAGHKSGLNRVSSRLLQELGDAATPVVWDGGLRDFKTGREARLRQEDWFFTSELFSEEERPGFAAFLAGRSCRLAAVFHDAIPLRHPHITWPQSVARHPGYMKLLAGFDRVWAVSDTSRVDLVGFWKWQGTEPRGTVDVLALGADADGSPRIVASGPRPEKKSLLCVGILEPRKNQSFLLDVCAGLWSEGIVFDLHLAGRVNPHFGAPIVARIKALQAEGRAMHHHVAPGDDAIAVLHAGARATVFPTIAEGCGLPLVESLWRGVPCVCSDLPVLRENARGGGCLVAAVGDPDAWKKVLRSILTDDGLVGRLTKEAMTRPLPAWVAAADALKSVLRG